MIRIRHIMEYIEATFHFTNLDTTRRCLGGDAQAATFAEPSGSKRRHELPEIDIASIARELLDKLDLGVLEKLVRVPERRPSRKKDPIRER